MTLKKKIRIFVKSFFISPKLWICPLEWTHLGNTNVTDAYKDALLFQSSFLHAFLLAS